MYVLIALAAMGFAGDPASKEFEGWTVQKTDLSPGEVRVIGTHPTASLKEGEETIEFYILDDPPQITFLAGGLSIVMLKILGHEEGRVNIGLDLDAANMEEETIQVSPKRPTELFLRVPEGTHMISVQASSKIMLVPQNVTRAPTQSDKIIVWAGREEDEKGSLDQNEAGSSFWQYKPDLSNFEHKEEGPVRRWSFWVNAGVGPSVDMDSSTSGLGFGGSANFRIDHYLLQIRSTYNMEMSVAGPEPQESLWELSPMVGFVLKGRVGWISAAAGVGLVGGISRGRLIEQGQEPSDPDIHEEKSFLNVGFPLDVQLFLKPPSFSIFGIGLNIYANLGPETSLVGLMVSIMAGG